MTSPPARPPRGPSPTPSSTSAARLSAAIRASRPRAGAETELSRLLATVAGGKFRALATGERFAEKPDHLTHLRDDASLVPKTHPRIVARGKLDLLQSALLDAQVAADADGARALVGELGEILELARALVGAEVTDRAVSPPTLWGMTADQIRDATHHTRELYGVPFMYPDVRQGPVVAKLSLARAIAREAEVAALAGLSSRRRASRPRRPRGPISRTRSIGSRRRSICSRSAMSPASTRGPATARPGPRVDAAAPARRQAGAQERPA